MIDDCFRLLLVVFIHQNVDISPLFAHDHIRSSELGTKFFCDVLLAEGKDEIFPRHFITNFKFYMSLLCVEIFYLFFMSELCIFRYGCHEVIELFQLSSPSSTAFSCSSSMISCSSRSVSGGKRDSGKLGSVSATLYNIILSKIYSSRCSSRLPCFSSM